MTWYTALLLCWSILSCPEILGLAGATEQPLRVLALL